MSLIDKLQEPDDNIPLADEDTQVIINDDDPHQHNIPNGRSMDSLRSSFTNRSTTPDSSHNSLETDVSPDEKEEKARLITQVLELQNTLDDLSQRVDSVKEENLKLRSENQVLGQYIENLMSASSVFQSTSPNAKKK
ncbi:PREDICTED: short coiled-coil protein A [Rhagoletis zephyria]|uniref:short coiled-coil protein A n=1 Tax=Rhagoletis zephyria TaxID=28612 RepID=UPI0008116A76|nr:PREDICTED: short coiled-coil protein A [Rhagoletis zephyria]XP_036330895.1 short coiled-coil protein A [Rhagoletis pomonella]